jgi:alanine-alpha-ketoisovalerate/valine-pyruvate aminotransferase
MLEKLMARKAKAEAVLNEINEQIYEEKLKLCKEEFQYYQGCTVENTDGRRYKCAAIRFSAEQPGYRPATLLVYQLSPLGIPGRFGVVISAEKSRFVA